ncbi:MAG: hypothetical protein HYV27_21435 [Candidatus Hydrogenedentes bacterium]|nr:hypothetical protein [Candidatus Hydrogenedentota bacterium]
MARHGIPPSPDRLEFQRKMIFFGGLIVLAACGVLYLFMRDTQLPESLLSPLQAGRARAATYAQELIRADAYLALREHVTKALPGPEIKMVYFRDSSHALKGEYIEFRGELDLERPGGHMDRQSYLATLRGKTRQGWSVLSFTMKDAPDLRRQGGQNPPSDRQLLPPSP